MKVGDLIRDTSDGVVGIIISKPYRWGLSEPAPDLPEANTIDVWWTSTAEKVPMHLCAFDHTIELIP